MGKKASKAKGNMYYDARSEAAERDETFVSREKASESAAGTLCGTSFF